MDNLKITEYKQNKNNGMKFGMHITGRFTDCPMSRQAHRLDREIHVEDTQANDRYKYKHNRIRWKNCVKDKTYNLKENKHTACIVQNTDMQIDRQTNRQTHRQTHRQTARQDRQTYRRPSDGRPDGWPAGQTDGQKTKKEK